MNIPENVKTALKIALNVLNSTALTNILLLALIITIIVICKAHTVHGSVDVYNSSMAHDITEILNEIKHISLWVH